MPTVAKSPNEKWLAAQSLDNKICIFTCGEKFKPYKKKEFKGHMVAGYACGLDFSPEMRYVNVSTSTSLFQSSCLSVLASVTLHPIITYPGALSDCCNS